MGGKNSEGYMLFQKKCVAAYLYLRKYAKLILNLFHLMLDSGIKVFKLIKNCNVDLILGYLARRFGKNDCQILFGGKR